MLLPKVTSHGPYSNETCKTVELIIFLLANAQTKLPALLHTPNDEIQITFTVLLVGFSSRVRPAQPVTIFAMSNQFSKNSQQIVVILGHLKRKLKFKI